MLIAVPNVSEGADPAVLDAITSAFTENADARVLGVHSDADHGRTVFTLAGAPGRLARALGRGAATAARHIDLSAHAGVHPHVGALDVAPVVFLTPAQRPAALAEALAAAAEIAEVGLPVLLYGSLAQGRTRAELRRGGVTELARRVAAGELAPDFGPPRVDPRRGAVLVAARPPWSPSTSSSPRPRRWTTRAGSPPACARAVPTGCPGCGPSAWSCGRPAASLRSP